MTLASIKAINISLLEIIPVWIRETPDHLKTQEMCNEAIHTDPYSLAFVPDRFKTQKMCDKAINIEPFTQSHDHDNLKMREMCIRAVEASLGLLGHIPEWFVTQQQIDVWYDGEYWYYDDELIQWYKGY